MYPIRRQSWLAAGGFVALGIIVGIAYQYFRAGHIQSAEGRREYDAGRFDLAEEAFLRATKANPANAAAWYWLGLSRKNQGSSAPAADALGKAVELEPGRCDWWFEYAQSLQWARRFAEAEQAWRHLVTLLPPDDQRVTRIRVDTARTLAAQGKLDPAVQMMEEILARHEDRDIRFALAELLAHAGRFEESVKQYHRALATQQE